MGRSLPEPESGGDFDPYFKAELIGEEGDTGKITVTGPPEEVESEFSDAQMPIRFKGKDYSFNIKWSSPNYRKLFEQFGKNPKRWKGTVKVEVKHFKKHDYVAIV